MSTPRTPHPVASQVSRELPATAEFASIVSTVRDAVRVAVSSFEAAQLVYGQGTGNSYDDAVALIYWALHLPVDAPDTLLDARISTTEAAHCLALVDERVRSRRPVAYLTGEAWLRGLRFRADERALVPRSLLVEAIQEGLDEWRMDNLTDQVEGNPQWPIHVLDLCTGSGSIAIHAANCYPDASLMAIDINADALSLCAENVTLHGLTDRIALRRSDLLADIGAEMFDLILCNPPYVPVLSMDRLPPEFRSEPALALAGGTDGMAVIRMLLTRVHRHLADDGVLLIEIGHEWRAFESAFPGLTFGYLPVTAGDQMIVAIPRSALPIAPPASVR